MMKIHFLGTGGAIPGDQRQNTSLLFEFDERLVLVDCSGTPLQSILRTGCDLDKLTDVVLTHGHVDHIYALPSLLHSLWLRKLPQEGNRIRLHGLQETLKLADQLIDVFGLRTKPFPLLIENVHVNPQVEERLEIECNGWILFAFNVTHGNIPAIGLYIDRADGTRLLFTADAIVDEAIESHLVPETKLLIHDCGAGLKGAMGHAGAEEINQLIRDTSIESVYLTHLPASLTEQELQDIVVCVSRDFRGNVIVPNDGDRIVW